MQHEKQQLSYDKTIHQLFEEQVLKTPENIALVCNNKQFTYNELNIKANQLAHHILDTYAVKSDEPVCLMR